MGAVAITAPLGSMSIAMMRSIASGAVRLVTAQVATIRPRRSTATAQAQTSASGAAPPPMAPVVTIAPPEGMRSEKDVLNVSKEFNVPARRLDEYTGRNLPRLA